MSRSRVLVIAPAWVGDMVMAQTLMMILKTRDAGTEIDVAAPPSTFPLLAHMPQVARAIPTGLRGGELALAARRRLGRSLRARRYDQAIVLPNSFKSALVPFFARIPVRTGWRGEMRFGVLNDARRLDRQRLPRMVDRFNALSFDAGSGTVADAPSPRLAVDAERRAATLRRLGLATDRPVLALAPGAEFGPAKRWPAARFAEVAQARLKAGWQVWIVGSPADSAAGAAIVAAVGASEGVADLTGRTTLSEAVDVLSLADAVLCNDSGLMHVAAALGRPLVVVYGSTSPDFTPPLSPSSRVVRSDLPCSPCFARTCRFGHTDCLGGIDADAALRALSSLERAA